MTPGSVYLADFNNEWWRVEILRRPFKGYVSFRWLAGPLAGREGRREAKTLRRVA